MFESIYLSMKIDILVCMCRYFPVSVYASNLIISCITFIT